jgi:hypothetical protein
MQRHVLDLFLQILLFCDISGYYDYLIIAERLEIS